MTSKRGPFTMSQDKLTTDEIYRLENAAASGPLLPRATDARLLSLGWLVPWDGTDSVEIGVPLSWLYNREGSVHDYLRA